MPTPAADRSAPPDVPPVVQDGVRYEQDLAGAELGGRLSATAVADGRRLWTLDVYAVPDRADEGLDAIGRYFRTMTLGADGRTLVIEDEGGGRHEVDLPTRTVVTRPVPGQGAPAPKPNPKPKPQP